MLLHVSACPVCWLINIYKTVYNSICTPESGDTCQDVGVNTHMSLLVWPCVYTLSGHAHVCIICLHIQVHSVCGQVSTESLCLYCESE